uniref:Cupin-like domain-containing protein n=1 Tax=Calcidiscus leptoporus TaxID=127549 RepID=A0A7S0JKY7_9EUKA|mmetsp:Transcript_8183/g.19205  ORF Transcript_8183/g.19205 Transcript_8183/m.19205 type:complete len:335 (+) Transcript_8183:157-1161(+)
MLLLVPVVVVGKRAYLHGSAHLLGVLLYAAMLPLTAQSSTCEADQTPHAMKASTDADTKAAAARASVRQIPRELKPSFAAFRRKYLMTGLPAILSGAMDDWPARAWEHDLARFETLCGAEPLYTACAPSDTVKVHAPAALGRTWGALLGVDVSPWLRNFSELLAAQADANWRKQTSVFQDGVDYQVDVAGRSLYLHDAPLASLCPRALLELRAPRYFPVDVRRQGLPRPQGECLYGGPRHPSLFIGATGSASGFHRDSEGSRFWMALLRGEKIFRLLPPNDTLAVHEAYPTACSMQSAAFMREQGRIHKPHLLAQLCPNFNYNLFEASPGAEQR